MKAGSGGENLIKFFMVHDLRLFISSFARWCGTRKKQKHFLETQKKPSRKNR
jgi:hypothetical protein